MKKYIFLDIDGTLFSNQIKGIPSSALEAIKLARENGHKVYLCTGRALPECKQYLDYDVDGFIFSAGANVYSNKVKIFEESFDSEFIKLLIEECNNLDIGYILGGNAGAYANTIGYKEVSKYFAHGEHEKDVIREVLMDNGVYELKDWHPLDLINKICVYANNLDSINKLETLLGDSVKFALSHNEGERYFGDVIRIKVNKLTGIYKVLEKENALIEDTICIGDSNNDIEMIKGCHIGIAMGNAFDNVKECADYITDDLLDDGIYNAFKKFNLI